MKIDRHVLNQLKVATSKYGGCTEFAKRVGVSRETVGNWINGKTTKIRQDHWQRVRVVLLECMAEVEFPELDTLLEFQHKVHAIAQSKGWWDTPNENSTNFMLMVSEIAEAMEADRAGNPPDDKIPEYSGIEAELADTVIRILDFAEGNGYDVIGAMRAKATFNQTRAYKHGGKNY